MSSLKHQDKAVSYRLWWNRHSENVVWEFDKEFITVEVMRLLRLSSRACVENPALVENNIVSHFSFLKKIVMTISLTDDQ